MNIKPFCPIYILRMVISTLLITAGCASTGADLVKKGVITVEHIPSRYAHTHRVSVHQKGTDIVISGELYSRFHQPSFIPGHVDIEVISPEGKLLGQGIGKYYRVGGRKSKSRRFEFLMQLSANAPQGSKIRIVHHPASLQEPRVSHPAPEQKQD